MNDALSPDEYMRLLDLGGQNEQLDRQVARQQAMSSRLRQFVPQQRMAGRQIVSPGNAEILASLLANLRAGQLDNKASGLGDQRGQNLQSQNRLVMRGILGRPQQAAPMIPDGQMVNPQGY
jgi:hypothetical protein